MQDLSFGHWQLQPVLSCGFWCHVVWNKLNNIPWNVR